ncbi:tyrosine recombinase [Mollicutes bacterium LVI A0078]|nr:tyrosine recombinase [Mollicutes bacterium LVI A0075]WOO91002.1 tyrosine recombinase [Mollicutes bacterium LVI A0078]
MNEPLIDSFLSYLKLERRLSENTCNSYRIDLMQFDTFINKPIAQLSKEDIDRYIKYLQTAYKENSYLRKVAALKSLNKYLRDYNLGSNDQIELLVAKKREKRIPKFLTQDQIDLFLNQFNGSKPIDIRNQAMFETLYATGMRVSEIINVKVTDVNLENGTIRVVGKGNKERIVILNQSSVTCLETYIYSARTKLQEDYTDILFLNNKGKPLTRQGFNFVLKKYASNVGITEISPHIFRHSIATHMLNNGGDLRMIQLLLGHANISTTEVYTHVSKQKILEEYDELHPLAKETYNE